MPENKETASKGRPTPPRKKQEAARKKPLIGDRSKEAKKAAKEKLAEERRKYREGMAAGEEKYLPIRDKGPQRRLARNVVDARFTLGELVLPSLFIVILLSSIPDEALQYFVLIFMYLLFVGITVDAWLIGRKTMKVMAAKFGEDKVEKGIRWYAAMRSIQMRMMRLPKPQVKRGEKVE